MPHVVVHVAVSLTGATTGFQPDLARFYTLAQSWHEDVTLVGADTILAQEQALASAAGPGPDPAGPLLAVVDSRARVSAWEALRDAGHWSDVLALRASSTPPHTCPIPELVAGADRVDLAAALRALGERAEVSVVRVDSGGALTGALLAAGLVDEISLLVHPLTGGAKPWYGPADPPTDALELMGAEKFDQGLAWLRYRVDRQGPEVES